MMDTLTGSGASGPLSHLTAKLGGELLAMAGVTKNAFDGADMILDKIRTGEAAERMGRMVAAMGGPSDFLRRWRDRLPAAPANTHVRPEGQGYVKAIDTEALGLVVVAMGGGRRRARDRINPSVGLSQIAAIGDRVDRDRPLARLHAAKRADLEVFEPLVRAAFQLSETPVNPPKLVLGRVE